jgi:hypothetical protein
VGRRLSVGHGGVVTVAGGFRAASGRWLRRGVRFRFVPTACGVRLRVASRPGDAFDYSAFFRARPAPARPGSRLSGGGQDLTFSPPASSRLRRGYASGLDPRLVRARLGFAHATGAGLSIATCAG